MLPPDICRIWMCPEPVDVTFFYIGSVVLTWWSELQLDLMFRRCLLELARGSALIAHLVVVHTHFPWTQCGKKMG